jgi:hypothetical protein
MLNELSAKKAEASATAALAPDSCFAIFAPVFPIPESTLASARLAAERD